MCIRIYSNHKPTPLLKLQSITPINPGYTSPDDFSEDAIRSAAQSQDTPVICPSAKHLPVTVRAVVIMMLNHDAGKRIGSKEVLD